MLDLADRRTDSPEPPAVEAPSVGAEPTRRRWWNRPRPADGRTVTERPKSPGRFASRQVTRAQITRWALVTAIVLAPVSLFLSCQALAKELPPFPKPDPVSVRTDVGVGGFAELYVSAYLSATEPGELAAFIPSLTDLPFDRPRAWASKTATIDITAIDTDYYAVVVAAEVLLDRPDDDADWIGQGTRFYAVGVQAIPAGDGFVATGLPSVVAAPAVLDGPELGISDLKSPSSSALRPVAEAVAGFLAAYVAGDGELARYVHPDSRISRIFPAPYVRVVVRGIGTRAWLDGDELVRAEVVAEDADGRRNTLHYSLLMRAGDRWEVTEVLMAPPLRPQPTPTPQPLVADAAPTTAAAPATTTAASPAASTPPASTPPASDAPASDAPASAPADSKSTSSPQATPEEGSSS